MMPKVSIIMPTYNREKYIKESIQGVLDQTYPDFELIIVDDASTDSTREIIQSYQDSRIKTIFCNRGRHVTYAENLGWKMAKGNYICRMDSDDIWLSTKLQKQVEFMEKNPEVGACFTKVKVIDKEGNAVGKKYNAIQKLYDSARDRSQKEWVHFFLKQGNCLPNPAGLIRTKALDMVGREHKLHYMPGEDFETWARLAIYYPIRILDEELCYCRWTEESDKISAVEDDRVNAFDNVHMLFCREYLDIMPDDKFLEYFQEEFVNPQSSSSLELECEKAFILMECKKKYGDINFLGLEKFAEILQQTNGLEILEEKFNFDLRTYYKEYNKRNFYSIEIDNRMKSLVESQENLISDLKEVNNAVVILRKELEDSQNDVQNMQKLFEDSQSNACHLKEELQNLQAKLENMESSISWKMTNPIRLMGDVFKKRN